MRHSLACTCTAACKRRHARYEKVRAHAARTGRALLVTPVGTIRRLRALMAAGWTLQQVAEAAGTPCESLRSILRNNPPRVQRRTAAAVATAYEALTALDEPQGPMATRGRRAAVRKGWHPPEAWEDDQLDDPTAEPYTGEDPIDDAWQGMLAGDFSLMRALSRADRLPLIDRWEAAGHPLAALTKAGMHPFRDRRRAQDRAAA